MKLVNLGILLKTTSSINLHLDYAGQSLSGPWFDNSVYQDMYENEGSEMDSLVQFTEMYHSEAESHNKVIQVQLQPLYQESHKKLYSQSTLTKLLNTKKQDSTQNLVQHDDIPFEYLPMNEYLNAIDDVKRKNNLSQQGSLDNFEFLQYNPQYHSMVQIELSQRLKLKNSPSEGDYENDQYGPQVLIQNQTLNQTQNQTQQNNNTQEHLSESNKTDQNQTIANQTLSVSNSSSEKTSNISLDASIDVMSNSTSNSSSNATSNSSSNTSSQANSSKKSNSSSESKDLFPQGSSQQNSTSELLKQNKQDDVLPHPEQEDEAGGYVDRPSNPSHNVFDQKDSDGSFRVEMYNARDVSFLAPVFIGTPRSQGAMVVYDTGSDWLTVKACITDKHCNKKVDKEATIKAMGEKAFEENGGDDEEVLLSKEEPEAKAGEEPEEKHESKYEVIDVGDADGADVKDTDNDGDGKLKPFSNPNKEQAIKDKALAKAKFKPVKVPDAPYNVSKSPTAVLVNNVAFPLSYGSADLKGFKYTDTVCLNPLRLPEGTLVTQEVEKQNFCVENFKYQAVMEAKGLDGCDGILGLSPKDYGSHSIIVMLKSAGLIDRMLISFSNAFYKSSFKYEFSPDPTSYMVFGGYNESQVVNGADGLFSMDMAPKEMNPTMYWGVNGMGFLYGDKIIMDPEHDPPVLAVIDSGTTLVMVPSKCYEGVMMGIADKVRDDPTVAFICTREEGAKALGACYFNNTRCLDVSRHMEPMKFIFGNVVYELKIDAFLKDVSNDGKVADAPPGPLEPGQSYDGGCMIELRPQKDKEDDASPTQFLMGNSYLKNFISVYDYDQQAVKLGVNVHSQSLAKAYPYKKHMFSKK